MPRKERKQSETGIYPVMLRVANQRPVPLIFSASRVYIKIKGSSVGYFVTSFLPVTHKYVPLHLIMVYKIYQTELPPIKNRFNYDKKY